MTGAAQGKISHEDQEEGKLDGKCDQVGNEDGNRHRQAGEIDLAKQICIADKGIGGLGQAGRKIGPDDRAGHVEQEWRQAVGGQFGDVAKDDREDDGGQQRLDEIPQRPQDGLFVNRDEVPPHEEHDQIAGAPQRTQA